MIKAGDDLARRDERQHRQAGEQPQAHARPEPGVEDVLTVGSSHRGGDGRTNGCAASGGERKRASTCGPPAKYPLPKVFSKLGISSRRQLRHYLALTQPGRRTA
jgi:hypothetical protein